MKPSLKALGLLFVMVMINSENAAGLQKSATIAEFEKSKSLRQFQPGIPSTELRQGVHTAQRVDELIPTDPIANS